MADEKSKNLTDTEQKTPPVPEQPEAAGAASAPKQEQPKPEVATPDKDKAPEQKQPAPDEAPAQAAPAKEEKTADAPKEPKAASVSVFNFAEIMAEKQAAEKAAGKSVTQPEAKAPEKPAPTKADGQKKENPQKQAQPPKRRGRPPKADKDKGNTPAEKGGSKQDKAAQKPDNPGKSEKTVPADKARKPEKTRFWLTPQLLQAHSSYVVVDPKGGTLSQCGYFLQKKKGYKIKVFNTIDFSKSMHYNPLAYIKTESDVLKFVNALIANTKGDGKEGDEFWTKAETLLYCALVAYIVFEGPEEERNMNTLVEMINSMEVREDDETFKNAVDYMFDGLAKRNPQHFAVRQYAKYKLASGKTAKSILISCGARLAPFDIAELREIMSYDELELDRLGDEKTALFFLISDTNTTLTFSTMMIWTAQMISFN